MGSVGTPELFVILLLALLVLGPDRLPQAARTVGKWVGELRRLTGSLQDEVRSVVDEVTRPVNETATMATDAFRTSSGSDDAGSTWSAAHLDEPATAATTAVVDGSAPMAADVPLPALYDDDLPSYPPSSAPPSSPAPVDPSLN